METLLRLAGSNAVAAIVLAAIVVVVTRFCRRPVVRHALWLLVLLKLITPPLVPLAVNWPRTEEIEAPLAEPPLSAVDLPPVSEPMEPIAPLPESPEPAAVPETDSPSVSYTFADIWLPLLMVVWLGGSLIWWIVAAVRLRKFQRLLNQARSAPVEVREQTQRLAALLGLRRCPPVVFVSAPLSPMLWALGFSPRLLVPAELWQRLQTEQQETLLAHELAHLRRGDHWVRRLEFVVLGLYWWHPVVWWARRRLQEAEEECCDALVVSILPDAASAYASALVETVAFLSQARAASNIGASGAGQVPLLKRRLTMILKTNSSSKPSRVAFWAVLGLGALLLPLAPKAARTETPQESQRPESQDRAADPVNAALQVQEARRMANCASCHESQTVHGHDLQHWPHLGREAHDEIVRLMDEVRRLQTQLGESAKRPPPVAEGNREEHIEKLKDEIELLKLQVRLKEAHLRSTKIQHAEVDRRYKSYEQTNRTTPGSFGRDALDQILTKAKTLETEIEVKEVELEEAQLLLKQAERRLARLQRPAERSMPQAPQSFSHDFGKVKQGTVIKYRFPLSNPNRHPLRIARISSSAGYLKAETAKREIEPGGKTMIDVELDTKRFQGAKTCVLSIQFEGGQERRGVFQVISEADSSDASREDKQTRLKELERKIESLQKEIRDLRREMKPKKHDGPGRSSNDPSIDAFKDIRIDVNEANTGSLIFGVGVNSNSGLVGTLSDDLIWKKLGLRLRTVGGDVVKRSMPQFRGGLIITEIRPDSPAQRLRFAQGRYPRGAEQV